MDERNHEAIKSKVAQKLGKFVGTHGKENCLVVCRTFGLTGCEWHTITGDCYAHMEKISVGEKYRKSYCYQFNSNPALGKIVLIIVDYKAHCWTAPSPSLAS